MLFGLEVLEIIFCIFVIAVGGFLRGFLGFGAALVIVPSLSLVLSPVEAIGILVIISFLLSILSIFRVFSIYKDLLLFLTQVKKKITFLALKSKVTD